MNYVSDLVPLVSSPPATTTLQETTVFWYKYFHLKKIILTFCLN